MAGSIFLGLLALIFILNVLIRFPFQKAVGIAEKGTACLENPGKHWFLLESDDYAVNESFSTIKIRSSMLPLISKGYTYYNITVTAKDGSFVMPVRVTAKKAEKLEKGETVRLYGMASRIDDESAEAQRRHLQNSQAKSMEICLNDNGDTVATRILSASVFALLSIGCIWLSVIIGRL